MADVNTKDVAQFMLQKLQTNDYLLQEQIVLDIKKEFGEEFVYINENGNPAIAKKVLTVFGKLKKEYDIEWDNHDKSWRFK